MVKKTHIWSQWKFAGVKADLKWNLQNTHIRVNSIMYSKLQVLKHTPDALTLPVNYSSRFTGTVHYEIPAVFVYSNAKTSFTFYKFS